MPTPQKLIVPARCRVEKNIVTRVYRKLGEAYGFTLSLGQEVFPTDSLGRGKIKSGFKIIALAEKLGVNPKDGLSYLKTKIGQNIYRGETIAASITSPVDGVIDFYNQKNGELRIKVFLEEKELICGMFGVVDEIDERLGVVGIRTYATLIHGVLGSGRQVDGRLEILHPRKKITEKDKSQIVVVPGTLDEDTIRQASALNIAGIICAGVSTQDGVWQDAGFGVVVTEGVGKAIIGEDILKVLEQSCGQFAILEGQRARLILPSEDQNSMIYIRKIRLPKVIADRVPMSEIGLRIGLSVRTLSPDLGQVGVVIQIDQSETMLPSGKKTVMVTIESKSRKMRLPLENIEVIY
ncbi:MAG: hypothetical protein Q7S88_01150 [Candidatus Daviesbacteria bacterium]|nr:hypothetical protein [Candidatus Daviesbacteria bacterium]